MSDLTKRFHIGDILTVITDRLVSPDHVSGLYNILDWLTDDTLMIHQLMRASDECRPFLIKTFPDLAAVEVPESIDSMPAVVEWLATLGDQWRDVPRLSNPADHARINPLLELEHMVGHDRVIPVVVDRDQQP